MSEIPLPVLECIDPTVLDGIVGTAKILVEEAPATQITKLFENASYRTAEYTLATPGYIDIGMGGPIAVGQMVVKIAASERASMIHGPARFEFMGKSGVELEIAVRRGTIDYYKLDAGGPGIDMSELSPNGAAIFLGSLDKLATEIL